ncbi:MAG: hypothetical protein ABSA02_19455 [Trebonia sp.]
MTPVDLSAGLGPAREHFLEHRPADPRLRQATNIWLHDDQGRFALPRFGVERVGQDWDRPAVQANIAFAGGRVLVGNTVADAYPTQDEHREPTVLGSGPVRFQCLEPFRRWSVRFHGPAVDTNVADQAAGHVATGPQVDVEIHAELTMAVPPWVERDGSPEQKLIDAGHRHEQLFTARGTLRVGDDPTIEFTASGLRIYRFGVRVMTRFHGHTWQAAVFPSGRAFGYTAFPDLPDGTAGYALGFVFDGERMYPATPVEVPWLTTFKPEGGDVGFALRSELGTHRVMARTTTSCATAGRAALAAVPALNSGTADRDLFLHQGGARYSWDGENAYGMVERALPIGQVTR